MSLDILTWALKQDKLIAGENITINGRVISASGGGSTPQYIELSWFKDGATGTLTDAQVQTLLASEINYIWLNGMHRCDFRYRDDNNNKATYSAVDTSSDGNKTHSVEINLTTKGFKVYHKTLVQQSTSNANVVYGRWNGQDNMYNVSTAAIVSSIVQRLGGGRVNVGTPEDATNATTKAYVDARATFQTTAPTAAITDGGVHIVYLSAEPETKYDGYIYFIAEE